MRFLILTQYFPPEVGASQGRLLAISKSLVSLGHEVEVVTGMPNYPEGKVQVSYRSRLMLRELYDDLPVLRVWLYPAQGLGWQRVTNYASFAASSLVGLARSVRPDVVFVESPPLSLVPSGVLAAKLWRVPVVMFVADPWPDSAVEVGALAPGRALHAAQLLERWCYRNVDCVSTPTIGLLELLKSKGIEANRLLFLPNGADVAMFKPAERDRETARELGVVDNERVVLYAGTVGHMHGVDVGIRAMELLRTSHPDVRLLIVGAGSELDGVKELARTLAPQTVSFVAPQPHERLARIWTLADIGLSTQRDLPVAEITRPAKMLASMASGKGLAYSGAGEGARLVEEAEAGIVVPPEDPTALATALAALLDDPELADRLGRNGREFVVQNLAWPAVVKTWLDQLPATSPRFRDVFSRSGG
jgi:colanic acid biosynthesis glycosyl transferase WcaI